MGEVIAFHDPERALIGAERDAALALYTAALEGIASAAVGAAFTAGNRVPGCGKLGCDDVRSVLLKAMRQELDRSGY